MKNLIIIAVFCITLSYGSQVRLTPTVKAVNRALPWVVSIGTEKEVKKSDPYYTRLNDYWGIYQYRIRKTKQYFPLGSGVIVHNGGLILTNWHVVRASEGNVIIKLLNGDVYLARIVGFDELSDLCLLSIDIKDKALEAASFARPDDLMLGETVITLGNPFGLDHSVSQGVLSAVNRNLDVTGENFDDILQTDASINPGNSGGPLINLDGDVIGLNQAIRSDAQGIGFAIPVKRLLGFISHWMMPDVSSDVSVFINFEQNVVGVSLVIEPETPPAKCGLKTGDTVETINGKRVDDVLEAGQILNQINDGQVIDIGLTSGKNYSYKARKMTDEEIIARRLGIRVQKITRQMKEALELSDELKGMTIAQVMPPRKYANEGLNDIKMKQGDLLFAVNKIPVEDTQSLAKVLRSKKSGDIVMLTCAVRIRGIYHPVSFNMMLQ